MEEIIEESVPVIGVNNAPDNDKMLDNDEKWCNFITKRAQMGKKENKVDKKELAMSMNPFSQELVIKVTTRLDPEAKIKDENGMEIPASSVIEKAKSTKVYKSAENRNRMMNCSATAQRMLWFITYEINEGEDYVEIDPEWYKSMAGNGSRNMYRKAIDELIRYGYITLTKYKYYYWVNPALIYCGNRIRKYPSKVVYDNVYTGKPQPRAKVVKTSQMPESGLKIQKKKQYPTE